MAGEDLMTPEQGPHELLVASASDIAALEALYADFAPDVLRWMRARVADADVARDLMAETFAQVVCSVDRYRGRTTRRRRPGCGRSPGTCCGGTTGANGWRCRRGSDSGCGCRPRPKHPTSGAGSTSRWASNSTRRSTIFPHPRGTACGGGSWMSCRITRSRRGRAARSPRLASACHEECGGWQW